MAGSGKKIIIGIVIFSGLAFMMFAFIVFVGADFTAEFLQ